MILTSMDLAYNTAYDNEATTLIEEGWKVGSVELEMAARRGVCQNAESYSDQFRLPLADFCAFALAMGGR